MDSNRFYHVIDDSFSYYHGKSDAPKGFDTHIHRSYEILRFISGDATYYIEGNGYQIQPNDVIFTNTRELHKIVFHSDEPYERKFLHFRPDFIVGFQTKNYNPLTVFENRKLGQNNLIPSKLVDEYNIVNFFDAIDKHSRLGTPRDDVMVKTTVIQLLVTMNQIFDDYFQQEENNVPIIKGNNKIAAILDYINNNLDAKITLGLLEKKFFLNQYHLCRIFKQTTGFTVIEYVTYKRMMKAKELLASGVQAIDVANATGYEDYSSFYRSFKKTVGVSPKQYADTHQ